MKKYSVILAVLLLLSLLSTVSFASEGGECYGKVYQAQDMKLDGKFDDLYSGGLIIRVNQDNLGNPTDEFARSYLVWEEGDAINDYLWVYTVVFNDWSLVGGSGEFYTRDSVELFLNYENSDDSSLTFQHVADALGNFKEYSEYKGLNHEVTGEVDKVVDVIIDDEYYFSGAVSLTTMGYAVEYKVPTPKLEAGMNIAYSMTIHNYPDSEWYFCESSMTPSNWNAFSYDYFEISDAAAEVNEDRIFRDVRETEPVQTEVKETKAPETKAPGTKAPETKAETAAPEQTSKPGSEPEKKGCGSVVSLPFFVLTLAFVPLIRKKH